MNKIVIYCSASDVIDASFNESAAALVTSLCGKGYGIVSGGTIKGTMGVIADAVAGCGGYHKGVLPRFMTDLAHPGLSETAWTDSMSLRKEEMRKDTAAAIALPGGIGTLDELIETLVLKKLHCYFGRVIVLNLGGFFEPLKALLDHYVATGMMTGADKDLLEWYGSVEDLITTL